MTIWSLSPQYTTDVTTKLEVDMRRCVWACSTCLDKWASTKRRPHRQQCNMFWPVGPLYGMLQHLKVHLVQQGMIRVSTNAGCSLTNFQKISRRFPGHIWQSSSRFFYIDRLWLVLQLHVHWWYDIGAYMNFEMSVNQHTACGDELRLKLITVPSANLLKWWTLNSMSSRYREIC